MGPGGGELRQSVKVGKLNLVDLAGSERVHITGATGTLWSHIIPDAVPATTGRRIAHVDAGAVRCQVFAQEQVFSINGVHHQCLLQHLVSGVNG